MNLELKNIKNSLIIGSNRGVGLAFVKQLLNRSTGLVHCLCRERTSHIELLKLEEKYPNRLKIHILKEYGEAEILALGEYFKGQQTRFDLILNCVGFLHDRDHLPEKSLKAVSTEGLLKTFAINAVISAMVAKAFTPLLSQKTVSVFGFLSAKVGSIEDNRMGGWYGYRMSKAALNMLIKNVAIENARKNKMAIVVALHPGTTETELSQPFLKNTPYKVHSPDQTANNLLDVISGLDVRANGTFRSWDSSEIPW